MRTPFSLPTLLKNFFNKDNFFHDKTSPYSKDTLPDRCKRERNGEVLCNYNNRLQLIHPTLIQVKENNEVKEPEMFEEKDSEVTK